MEELTDEEIARKVQEGDKEAFGVLVTRFETKMHRYASKFLIFSDDSKDIVQNVFLKAYMNIQSFDVTRKFSSWLYRIAHNEFINHIGKRSRNPFSFFSLDEVLPFAVGGESADGDLKDVEVKMEVEKYLSKLDSKYREVLILHFFEELSYAEIADILRIPVSTVGVRLRRAKQSIQDLYKKGEGK